MTGMLRNLRAQEVSLLFQTIQRLSEARETDEFRQSFCEDLLSLVKADFAASFVWSPDEGRFTQCVALNMDPGNLAKYDAYYQFRDPITFGLQRRKEATFVSEVLPQNELEKTEFFNDFLMADGLHHGMNLFAYDRDRNVGDVRIWRKKNRPDFGWREAIILDTLLPHFRNALLRIEALKTQGPLDGPTLARVHHLTAREAEVGVLVYQGLTDREIASALGVAFSTVRTHLKSLFTKLAVTNRSELVYVLVGGLPAVPPQK